VADEARPVSAHISELRKRLTRAAIFVVIATVLAFVFHEQILRFMMGPASQFEGIPRGKPVFTDMTEMIGTVMKVSLFTGIGLALPFIIFEIVRFASPGLTKQERRYLYILLPAVILSFITGVAFGYYVLLPPAISFLLNFGSDIAEPLIRIGSYLNLVVALLFWLGVSFETPIVMMFLARIGIVTPEFLASKRRIALVVAFVAGALITPTFDPINQTFVAVPLFVLYEIGIWLAKLGARARRRARTETPTEVPPG
jgi:sec-independent protein translocase protein TatC